MLRLLMILMIFLQGVAVSAQIDKIEINELKVPLIYEQSEALPIVSLQVVIQGAGSMFDKDKPGLARFSSAMLGEGTKALGATAFANALESKAISLSANAGAETFVFEISSLKEHFPFALKMLKELFADPNFTQESFSKIKSLIYGGLLAKENDFDYIANVNLKKMIFEDTPIGHPFSGTKKSIEALELKDIEEFYKKHINLANVIVVIGGDIQKDEVKEHMKTLLADLKIGEKVQIKHYNANDDEENLVVQKESEQAYIYFGAPYFMESDSKDIYKSKVAGFILGESGFGSRLMEEIRVKRGLAYSAYSRMHINKSNSYFSGHLQTKNENLEEAKKIVKEEIEKFVKKGVTKEEFEQAKRFLLGSEPLRNETLSQRLSRAFHEYYRGFEVDYFKDQLKRIENLSLEDLNSFIKNHEEITKLSFSVVTNSSESK